MGKRDPSKLTRAERRELKRAERAKAGTSPQSPRPRRTRESVSDETPAMTPRGTKKRPTRSDETPTPGVANVRHTTPHDEPLEEEPTPKGRLKKGQVRVWTIRQAKMGGTWHLKRRGPEEVGTGPEVDYTKDIKEAVLFLRQADAEGLINHLTMTPKDGRLARNKVKPFPYIVNVEDLQDD